MADRKIVNRGKKTPLQLANTPNMDRLAREGECGMTKTLPPDLPRGSDVAIMSLLGYDPAKFTVYYVIMEYLPRNYDYKNDEMYKK